MTARLAQRVDGVDGGPGVRQADRDVAVLAQRGRRDGHVRIGPGEGRPADALQLLLQVQGHVAAGPHAVDVDPAGLGQRVHDLGQGGDVEVARGVGHGPGVGEGDLLGDGRSVIVGVDVAGGGRDGRRVVVGHRAGQRQAQLGVAAQPDGPAEAHHAGGRRAAGAGQLGDAPPGHPGRIVQDHLGHAALDRREVRQQRPDGDQDPDVGALIRSCLVFGHAVRLPLRG